MHKPMSPGPVVVAIDGSNAAIGAAEWAAKEALHQDVPLRLVHVIKVTMRKPRPSRPTRIQSRTSMPKPVCTPLVRR